jgi:phosphatidylglycerophosphate synthase
MIDARLLPLQRALLQRPALLLSRLGIHADAITLCGFLVGLLAFAALVAGQWMTALALILANRILDGLDGAVARIKGATDRGAFLDIALDVVFYALVPLGFAIHDPTANALPGAILIASFIGTGSSFLAFSVVATKQGRRPEAFPAKGIFYVGGLAEGFETIAVFIALCLLPDYFAEIAYAFAAICAVTTVLRWYQGWVVFSGQVDSQPPRERP